MRKIVIGFSTPRKYHFSSHLIRLFEGSRYSHIYVVLDSSGSSPLSFPKVFQASRGMVNAIKYDNMVKSNHVIHEYSIQVTDDQYYGIATWLWDQLGKDYGFMQLIGIGLGIKIKSNDTDKYICSELAAMVLDMVGVSVGKDQDYIGLNDVKMVLDNHNLFIE